MEMIENGLPDIGTISGNDIDTPPVEDNSRQPEYLIPDVPPIQNNDNSEIIIDIPSSVSADTASDETHYQEIMDKLDLLKNSNESADITERLDTLIDVLTMELEERELTDEEQDSTNEEVSSFPIENYTDWIYPVTVCSESCALGTSGWIPAEDTFTSTADLDAWYTSICSSKDTSITDFRIVTVTDANGDEVYHIPAESEQVPDSSEDILLYLQDIRDILETIQQDNLLYQENLTVYQQDERDLQIAQTGYSALTALGVFIFIGFLGITELFKRMK